MPLGSEPPPILHAATPIAVPFGELFALAVAAEQAGRLDEADRLLGHILAVAPNEPETLHLAGVVAFRLGRHADALALMERAIVHGGNTALYLRNICELYRTLGRPDDALAAALQATAMAPHDPVCLHNLAVIRYERLEIDACIAAARRALALDPALPGAHFELAEALLLRGEMAEGWEEYEWRFRIAGAPSLMPPTDRPQWDGAPLAGRTLLLIADQGFGDVIQFSRYIPWARERCSDLAIACGAEMAPLISQLGPGIRQVRRWEDCPPYAAFCPLSGLPRLHGTRVDSILAPVPYLRADPARAEAWADRLGRLIPPGFRRIGIVWAGRPTHTNDRNRSASLAAFAPVAALPGIALVSLQKGPAARQAGSFFARAPLVHVGAEIQDFEDSMAILDNLDLLVSVDTSVVHLAGAMGRPAWVMLPRAPDWRWLLDRTDSPWYPTIRLFRQRAQGEWHTVAADVAQALRQRFGLTTAAGAAPAPAGRSRDPE
ncbi:tetratricopeptide repeat-containing glycosyltransferase family protein [Limobrevibacterium gyesilva]|uniref:Tetratricopeptide repeat-containing glycosyltransferase family protein n=1 Tax=Limobrevibacterium gyesilva TaxID=2991712 RepID=A0AA41YQK1_9PROT|nr:tetratricopeptide repeat-containing glycosyltransferase family protein [Limobrevibacterium gyesilva]MCW3474803.1 tetratricopeptide repeat-containing glycosyltransferase family protein [Limobrevibacterium gyesilva]